MVAPRQAMAPSRSFAAGMIGASPGGTGPAVSSSTPPTQATTPVAPFGERTLTPSQVEAIRSAMKLFVEDDISRGVAGHGRIYCDGCERPRASAGVIQYDRYVLCNGCAIEYEVARARGAITTPGQYVRDKHFGDGDLYALAD